MSKLTIFAAVCFLLLTRPASATVITFTVTPLGGSSFDAAFEVTNDVLGLPIDEFSVFFDLGIFENLRDPVSPAAWDPLIIQPDPGIPDDGFADWLALGDPIGVGETVAGFGLAFDLVGTNLPASLAFNIIDADTFEVLDSGFAELNSNTNAISLPNSIWLLAAGCGFFWRRLISHLP